MNELIFLALFQTATLTLDGASTLWEPNLEYNGKIYKTEEVGIAKAFIGKYPTWKSMAPWGITEVALFTTLSYILKKNNIKLWYIPQISVGSIHLGCATTNVIIVWNCKY